MPSAAAAALLDVNGDGMLQQGELKSSFTELRAVADVAYPLVKEKLKKEQENKK